MFSLFEGFFEEDFFEVAVFEGCLEVNRCISRDIPSSCSFPTKSRCIPMRVYFNQYSSQTNRQHNRTQIKQLGSLCCSRKEAGKGINGKRHVPRAWAPMLAPPSYE